jgi:hypothetical protein
VLPTRVLLRGHHDVTTCWQVSAAACCARGGRDAAGAAVMLRLGWEVVGITGAPAAGVWWCALLHWVGPHRAPAAPLAGCHQVAVKCTPQRPPVMGGSNGGHTSVIRWSYGGHSGAQRSPSAPDALAQVLEGHCAAIIRVCMHQCCAAGRGRGRGFAAVAAFSGRRGRWQPAHRAECRQDSCYGSMQHVRGWRRVGAGGHLCQAAAEVRRRAASTG